MKKMIMLVAAALISSSGFADTGFSKNSPQLNALGSAWKAKASTQPKINSGITMGYGGEDISRKPTLALNTTTA